MRLREQTAQTVLEVTLLTVVIAAGLLAMSVYLKRSVVGRLRVVTDQAGEQFSTSTFSGRSDISFQSSRIDHARPDGTTQSVIIDRNETQQRTGSERVGAQAAESLYGR